MSEDTDGWTPHDGKGMPVDGDTLVTVRFRSGVEEHPGEAGCASFWGIDDGYGSNWSHAEPCEFDIVAYRIHQPSPSKESAS